ncbi:MAG: vancomycin resistance histidine kinase VanS [Massiliimalia sp.]
MTDYQKSLQEKNHRSQIIRQLLQQYMMTLAVFVVLLVVLILICWGVCHMFIWYSDDPVYQILSWFEKNLLVLGAVIIFAGWTGITCWYLSKAMRFLNEAVSAFSKLVQPKETPIQLPEEMKSVQDELNLVRERALRSDMIAKEAEQRKNDLIVYLAHDLKTPLTSVIGYLTLLRDEREISEELRQKYLSISLDKAERLEELINEFFEITRFNLSDVALEYSTVNLTRMLEQLVFEFQPMFLEKGITCQLTIAPDLSITCDPDKMQRVFDNLLRNAVSYSFSNSQMKIMVTEQPEGFHLTFSNEGKTIPPEKLSHIFDRFYRLDTARATHNGGAGLGLAIAREIVQMHGGTIAASSRDDTVVFEIFLPKKGSVRKS